MYVRELDVDYGTAEGALKAALFLALAEYFARKLGERTKAGLEAARLRGERIGRQPYVWTALDDQRLRQLAAAGWAIKRIHREGGLRLFRGVKVDGEWTERASSPSRKLIRTRMVELGLKKRPVVSGQDGARRTEGRA